MSCANFHQCVHTRSSLYFIKNENHTMNFFLHVLIYNTNIGEVDT